MWKINDFLRKGGKRGDLRRKEQRENTFIKKGGKGGAFTSQL
jgi:hypothetical protein